MDKIKVDLGSNSYEVRIGSGLLSRVGLWLKEKGYSGRAVVIADATVNGLYGEVLERGLANAGFKVSTLLVPSGEEQKTLQTAGRLYEEMSAAYAERTTPVLTLGGGVVGDLGGFVAATYMRGVPLVQVPTTLLAQVDSSIGGKTAVDHEGLKNAIGAFYQPRLVIADVATLKSLPQDELSNGLAEVIKHAAIRSQGLFRFLDINMAGVMSLSPEVMEKVVTENARIKADVVARDERETGLRAILNYGHTVGHAVETVSGFQVKHGQAVAIGMVAAARISVRMGILPAGEMERLKGLIKQAGLPPEITGFDVKEVVRAMQHDKKVQQNKIRFVLLKSIGEAFVTDAVNLSLVEEVLSGE